MCQTHYLWLDLNMNWWLLVLDMLQIVFIINTMIIGNKWSFVKRLIGEYKGIPVFYKFVYASDTFDHG